MQPSVKCEKRAPCLTAYAIAPLRRVLIGRVAPNRRSAHEARPESGRPPRWMQHVAIRATWLSWNFKQLLSERASKQVYFVGYWGTRLRLFRSLCCFDYLACLLSPGVRAFIVGTRVIIRFVCGLLVCSSPESLIGFYGMLLCL